MLILWSKLALDPSKITFSIIYPSVVKKHQWCNIELIHILSCKAYSRIDIQCRGPTTSRYFTRLIFSLKNRAVKYHERELVVEGICCLKCRWLETKGMKYLLDCLMSADCCGYKSKETTELNTRIHADMLSWVVRNKNFI